MLNKLIKHTGIILIQISLAGLGIVLHTYGMHHTQWLNLAPLLAIVLFLFSGFFSTLLGLVGVKFYNELENPSTGKNKDKVNLDKLGLIFYFTEPALLKIFLMFLLGILTGLSFYNACFFSGLLNIVSSLLAVFNSSMAKECLTMADREIIRREGKSND